MKQYIILFMIAVVMAQPAYGVEHVGMDVAVDAVHDGDYQKAVSVLKDLASQNPNDAGIQYTLAQAYARQGNAPEAALAFERAKGLDPKLTFAPNAEHVSQFETWLSLHGANRSFADALPRFEASHEFNFLWWLTAVGFGLFSAVMGHLAFKFGSLIRTRLRERKDANGGCQAALKSKMNRLEKVLDVLGKCGLIADAVPNFSKVGKDDLRVLKEAVGLAKSRLARSGNSDCVSETLIAEYEADAEWMFAVLSTNPKTYERQKESRYIADPGVIANSDALSVKRTRRATTKRSKLGGENAVSPQEKGTKASARQSQNRGVTPTLNQAVISGAVKEVR